MLRRAGRVIRSDAADALWGFTHPGAAWRYLYATRPRIRLAFIEAAMLNAALLCLLLTVGVDPGTLLVTWRDATAAEVRQHQSDVLSECMDLYRETGRQC